MVTVLYYFQKEGKLLSSLVEYTVLYLDAANPQYKEIEREIFKKLFGRKLLYLCFCAHDVLFRNNLDIIFLRNTVQTKCIKCVNAIFTTNVH